MKKKKLKKQLNKTEKKLERAKAEIKELKGEKTPVPEIGIAPELKVMAAR